MRDQQLQGNYRPFSGGTSSFRGTTDLLVEGPAASGELQEHVTTAPLYIHIKSFRGSYCEGQQEVTLGVQQLGDAQVLLCQVESVLKVVVSVRLLQLIEVDQIGPEHGDNFINNTLFTQLY